jgi:hypothetical protein
MIWHGEKIEYGANWHCLIWRGENRYINKAVKIY